MLLIVFCVGLCLGAFMGFIVCSFLMGGRDHEEESHE